MREPCTAGRAKDGCPVFFIYAYGSILLNQPPCRAPAEALFKQKMPQEDCLCLSSHDELYIIDLDRVLYMQADDHYTDVYYTSGNHFMIPFGLGKIEAALTNRFESRLDILRLGRKYLVNMRRIFRINTVTELLYLTDNEGTNISLHVSKPVLRSLIDMMNKHNQQKHP